MSRILSDCHMHTVYSPDGQVSPEKMAERAKELGIGTVALTDHCEVEDFYSGGFCTTAPQALKAARKLAADTKEVEVLAGIELGQPGCNFDLSDRILAGGDYDFVLAAVHRLTNYPDFYYCSDTPERAKPLWELYWKEVLRVVQWGNFDSFAHITYPLRFVLSCYHIREALEWDCDAMDEALALLAQKGKALEINTAGLRSREHFLQPHERILRRFRELGGTRVTFGSDAHVTENVGFGISEAQAAARELGFTGVTVYRHREPVELP